MEGPEIPPRVLILEDNMLIAADIGTQLDKAGFCIQGIFSTSVSVLKSIDEKLPDLIMIDINLQEELEGIEVANQIRLIHTVPILLASAMPFHQIEPHFHFLPNVAFLCKPFGICQLQRAINKLLDAYTF